MRPGGIELYEDGRAGGADEADDRLLGAGDASMVLARDDNDARDDSERATESEEMASDNADLRGSTMRGMVTSSSGTTSCEALLPCNVADAVDAERYGGGGAGRVWEVLGEP